MDFRTIIPIDSGDFQIEPLEDKLFVGSCFATNIGNRFAEDKFRATVNPLGVMYNPASILHTVEACGMSPRTAVFTLGTNHVYRLRQTGQIVDNCEKRPQNLFQEEELSIDDCADYLQRAIEVLRQRRRDVRVILTVSPIRYRKYGYHESQLSKSTLLLAVDKVVRGYAQPAETTGIDADRQFSVAYFPAYEIIMDELRDYRFYAADMLHPSEQAVEYIWQRFAETYFSPATHNFLAQWLPIKAALNHRPFNPNSEDYRLFREKTCKAESELMEKYAAYEQL